VDLPHGTASLLDWLRGGGGGLNAVSGVVGVHGHGSLDFPTLLELLRLPVARAKKVPDLVGVASSAGDSDEVGSKWI
jgi:hypothetical protein